MKTFLFILMLVANLAYAAPATQVFPGFSSVKSVSADYSMVVSDLIISVNASAVARTVTLVDATKYSGKVLLVKKDPADTTANFVTVKAFGAQTVEGQAQYNLAAPGAYVELASTGTAWIIKNVKNPWRVYLYQTNGNVTLSSSASNWIPANTSNALATTNPQTGTILGLQACASGEDSSGSTCSGQKSVGFGFVLPNPGTVQFCFSVKRRISATGGAQNHLLRLVETPNAATTIIQYGSRIAMPDGGQSTELNQFLVLCDSLQFATAGKKTVRLFHSPPGGFATGGEIMCDNYTGSASGGSPAGRSCHWEATPMGLN